MVWSGISYDGSTDLYVIRNGLVFEIQLEESLTIHQRVHLLALVGSLTGFVDLKSDVARCPKHVLSDVGPGGHTRY
jgi:hypothetical protein